ncbi:hypothetical protein CHF27_005940 [Romboutsia maritimum]|uniref:DUF4363 family protein n=1 Tax=Romboutsia maritimum TaxID=2020948 RepID=A0A255HQ73_9FIRM|nr:hypothetical protein [Romboutsia maritimum]RDY23891.1 hypothetical protein CHF27_005940 [Romboutsia maritimum]
MKKIISIAFLTFLLFTNFCFADTVTYTRYLNDLVKVNHDLKLLSKELVQLSDDNHENCIKNVEYIMKTTDSLQKNIVTTYNNTADLEEQHKLLYLIYINTVYSISIKEARWYLDKPTDINHLIKMLSSQRTGDMILLDIKE